MIPGGKLLLKTTLGYLPSRYSITETLIGRFIAHSH